MRKDKDKGDKTMDDQDKTPKINLLFVDDEEAFLESITKRLEVRDFKVIAVNRGEKAVAAARENRVDVALVDLKMPGMDGEATLKALKDEHSWMEVVILTGHGSIDSAVSCAQSGAYFYLQKPCTLERLLEVLADAYKKVVMNRMSMKQEKLEEILKKAENQSPIGILRSLRELDKRDG